MSEIGHLKIALTTNGLTQVDANFNGARQVVFYDVASDSSHFLDLVQFKGGAKKRPGAGKNGGCWMMDAEEDAETADGVDPLAARLDALKGCAVLFTKGIGDPAAMRVKDLNVFPVKLENSRDIDDVIVHLQKMMANDPPPLWIRKAMGHFSQDSCRD